MTLVRESALNAKKLWQYKAPPAAPLISPAHISRMEQEIRDALKNHRTVYESEKDLLQKLFRYVRTGECSLDVYLLSIHTCIFEYRCIVKLQYSANLI